MTTFRTLLGKDALAWRLAALAAMSYVVARLSILFVKVFHQLLPVMPTEAIMLVVLLTARPRWRWMYLGALLVGHTAAGYFSEHHILGR
ncbi:MAG TPA: hypothetical protein VG960_14250, partial [Caulobacteraceae bacterium]|nr:hypothetical protein [Caulobacteraceae bacterium]